MEFPNELRYTPTHEWSRKSGDRIRVGITAYAQQEISDVVYVELPKLNTEVTKGKSVAVVESVKAAFEIYAPVSGKVVEINKELESNPGHVNQDPYGKGWLFAIEIRDSSEWDLLLSADAYKAQCITIR